MAQLGNSGGRFDTIATPLAYLPVGYELAIAAFGAFAQKMSARAAGKLRNTAHTKNFRNSVACSRPRSRSQDVAIQGGELFGGVVEFDGVGVGEMLGKRLVVAGVTVGSGRLGGACAGRS